jgi:hypothetical protein
MLTKGHHFPAVQLVGIIDADALLYSADFRGEERMAQLITQVSGRAGRERAGGEVLVQTHYPADPLFELLQDGDYTAVADTLLQRREGAGPAALRSSVSAAHGCTQRGRRRTFSPDPGASRTRTLARRLPAYRPPAFGHAAPRRSVPLAAVVCYPATRVGAAGSADPGQPWRGTAPDRGTELVYRCRPGGRTLTPTRNVAMPGAKRDNAAARR